MTIRNDPKSRFDVIANAMTSPFTIAALGAVIALGAIGYLVATM